MNVAERTTMSPGRFGAAASNENPAPRPRSRDCGAATSSVRCGFTLMETMLVLALLVALAALVSPALNGPFAAERLRKGADQLHADLTRARATAIRSGHVHQLLLDASTARYALQPLHDVTDSVTDSAAGAGAPAAAPGGDPLLAGVVETRTLPDGISLIRVEALDDVTPAPLAAGFSLPQAPTQAGAASSTVYFHPDGTTSSARFTLVNEKGLFLRVELRGLTGTVAVSDLLTSDVSP